MRLPKVDSSKHFEGLDMLTKLLAPAGKTHIKQPLIEVVEGWWHFPLRTAIT